MTSIMTEEEFIKMYCKNSEISQDELLKDHVVLPCNCGDKSCKGWAVVANNTLSIKAHLDLYT